MVQPLHGMAWNFFIVVSCNALIPLLGKYQTRVVFPRSGNRSVPGNERNFYKPSMVYFIYAWPCFTFVSFVAGFSKRFSNFWNQSQAMDSYNKRYWYLLFICYLHSVCLYAHCIYSWLAYISFLKKNKFFQKENKIINTNV